MSYTPSLRIAQVEKLTGVGAHTLRAWERRYGVPAPDRSGGKQRMYAPADVELVRRMHELSAQGVPLARAAAVALAEREGDRSSPSATPVDQLLEALLSFDEVRAGAVWSTYLGSFDVAALIERLAVPALIAVGDGWHVGNVSVGQEHFASNFVRGRLEALARQALPEAGAPTVLLACLAGERHDLALLMLDVLLRLRGLRTVILGQDVPDDALVCTAGRVKPAVIALSAGSAASAASLRAVVNALVTQVPGMPIVFGGHAFQTHPELRTVSGAVYGGLSLVAAANTIGVLARRRQGKGVLQ